MGNRMTECLGTFCGPNVWRRWSCGKGDISGWFQLLFDNVATTLTLTFLLGKYGLGILADAEIYNGFLPGLGIAMVFGNVYYSWMGCRLSAKEDRRDVTCNPYGINTPAAFAFLFGVLAPAAGAISCPEGIDPASAECYAWKSQRALDIGVAANFVQGAIAAALGLVGPWVQKVCPTASLVSALGGIGITFLGVGQLAWGFEQPLVGLVPIFLMVIIYFGGLNTRWAPEALVIAGAGTVLAWMDGVATPEQVQDSLGVVGWHTPMFLLVDMFESFQYLNSYWGVILPIAVYSAANTLMCWQTAVKNGDKFPLCETMVVDGLGSMVAAIFGCPFGTSVYIGHTAYKRVGAKSGYSLLNAGTFLILCLFGLFGLVQAIIPITAVAPIIVFVGLMISGDAFESVPIRHIPAVVLGFMPSIADWAVNQCSMETADGQFCSINTAPANAGLVAFKNGSLLVAMILAAIFALTIDRKYLQAALWSLIAAFFSLFGLIHAPAASADFDNGTSTAQWRFAVGYLMVGAIMLIIWVCQRFGNDLVDAPVADDMAQLSVAQLVATACKCDECSSVHSKSKVEDQSGSSSDSEEEPVKVTVDDDNIAAAKPAGTVELSTAC